MDTLEYQRVQKDFILDHNLSNRPVTIAACIIILVAFIAFSFWDAAVIGWDHPRLWDFILYRHLVGDPMVIATLVYCLMTTPRIRLDWLMTINMILVCNSILIMYILLFEIQIQPQIEGILVFILGTLFLSSLFYYQKLIICLFAICSYVAVLAAYDQGVEAYLHAIIYLSIIAVAGIVHSIAFDRKSKLNYESNKILQDLAHTDQLTGAENRHMFDDQFHLLLEKAKQDRATIALAIVDIDYFKQYNDTYGHLAGDECLVKVARTLLSLKSDPEDRCVRFGGEEFILIKYNLEESLIADWAREIPELIRSLHIPHKSSSKDNFLTASAGISYCLPNKPKEKRQLMAEADSALYQAKSQGRNRAVLSEQIQQN